MAVSARLRSRRARCSSSRKGTREYTGTTSYTPSPKMKPRSRTETFASSMARNFPFRKTMQTSAAREDRSLHPEPQCIPGAAEDARLGHRLEGEQRVLAQRLSVERHAQRADALPLRDGRDQR